MNTLAKCNYLVNKDLTPKEMGATISKFIHEHAILISNFHSPIEVNQAKDILDAQKYRSRLDEAHICRKDLFESTKENIKTILVPLETIHKSGL
jgi:hypothetical protein